MLDLVFNNLTKDKTRGGKFFEKILDAAFKVIGMKFEIAELSINLVSERKIKELNKKYRGKDKTTDVLSFPLAEHGLPRGYTNQGLITFNGVNGIMSLGDIFICLSVAEKDAKKGSVSLSLELALLTVHGFLHLLGYDHEKSIAEKEKMFALQDKILNKIIL